MIKHNQTTYINFHHNVIERKRERGGGEKNASTVRIEIKKKYMYDLKC